MEVMGMEVLGMEVMGMEVMGMEGTGMEVMGPIQKHVDFSKPTSFMDHSQAHCLWDRFFRFPILAE